MLIVNGSAGQGHAFAGKLEEIRHVCAASGMEVQVAETTAAPDSACELARRAAGHSDLVIACGGDGTVHGVLQGVVNTRACLGVLPFGTANALARNLGLPIDAVAAMHKLLQFVPQNIPLCVATSALATRWFTVMAGAGPDGRLVHEMKLAAKARSGRRAYYTEAARIFARAHFPAFTVRYRGIGSQLWESREAVALMASRIPNLGGLFAGLTRHSRLHHSHLLVQLLAAPAHLSLPAWFAFGHADLGARNPWMTTVEVEEVECSPIVGSKDIYAQVDGEAFGSIPMSLRIESAGLRLLMPRVQL